MRYLTTLVVTFFTSLIFSQSDGQGASAFVWAKSGLTLRDAGSPDGKEITVIPYGTRVEVVPGTYTGVFNVPALPEVVNEASHSQPWQLSGNYTQVRFGEHTGYVFDPYLLPYETPAYDSAPADNQENLSESMGDWMNRVFGKPDTISSSYNSTSERGSYVLKYPNGVLDYGTLMHGYNGTEMVWPGLNLARGFVLLDHFWSISECISEKTIPAEEKPYLIRQQPDQLDFWLGPDSDGTSIRQVGFFLFIGSYASC